MCSDQFVRVDLRLLTQLDPNLACIPIFEIVSMDESYRQGIR